jgi:hypothetical protein
MYKMILAAVAIAVPLTLSTLPASAAVTPERVWSELRGAGFGPGVTNGQPGHLLGVMSTAQAARLEQACRPVNGRGYSPATIEFCQTFGDEVDDAKENRRDD